MSDRAETNASAASVRRHVARAAVRVARAVGVLALITLLVPVPGDPALARSLHSPPSGRWRELPPAPLAARWGAFSAWTGDELLVWGGYTRAGRREGPRSDGAAFDGGAWAKLPAGPLPPLLGHGGVAAWTGRELWIAGGTGGREGRTPSRAAAAYRPTTRRWRVLPDVPEPIGGGAWVGDRLVVVAAGDGRRPVYALRPRDHRWRRLGTLPAPRRVSRDDVASRESRAGDSGADNSDLHVLADGDRVAVVGLGAAFLLDVGSHAARWRRVPPPCGARRLPRVRGAVMDATGLVVVLSGGTHRYDVGDRAWSRLAGGLRPDPPQAVPLVRTRRGDLVAVDVVGGDVHLLPEDGGWVPLAALPEPRVEATVATAGDRIVVWGGMGAERRGAAQGWTLAVPERS